MLELGAHGWAATVLVLVIAFCLLITTLLRCLRYFDQRRDGRSRRS